MLFPKNEARMTMWDKLVLSQREEVLVAVSCLYAIDLEDFRCLDDCICSVNLFAVHWGAWGHGKLNSLCLERYF